MSEQEFEAYLRLLSRFLRLSDDQREALGLELRGHMEERLEELTTRGYTREEAIHTVLDEFGDAAALAGEFDRGRSTKRRWIMRTTAGTAGIAVAILLISFLLPENRPLSAPSYSHAEHEVEQTTETIAEPSEGSSKPRQQGLLVGASGESAMESVTREKLSRVIGLDFPDGLRFADTLQVLREKGDLSIVVNWNELFDFCGIDQDTEVHAMRIENARIETILDLLLRNIGTSEVSVEYDIVDGIVRISTSDEIDRTLDVRVYDVRDLIYHDLPAAVIEAINVGLAETPQQATFGDTGFASPAGAPVSKDTPESAPSAGIASSSPYRGDGYSGSAWESDKKSVAAIIHRLERYRVEDLQEVIMQTVERESWSQEVGSIQYFDGMLIVAQTSKAHQQLADLLATIRRAIEARPVP